MRSLAMHGVLVVLVHVTAWHACGAAVSADRMEAISQLKNELHTLTPAEATRRFAEVGAVHRLSKPNPRQTKIDHFVMLYMEVRAHRDVAPRAMGTATGVLISTV